MPSPPVIRDAITAALKDCGPMGVVEIAKYLGLSRSKVDHSITRARENHPGKFFRIASYQLQSGTQGREARIYAAGPGKDVMRPAFDSSHITARKHAYYLRNRAMWAVKRKSRNGAVASSPWTGLVQMVQRATDNPTRTTP